MSKRPRMPLAKGPASARYRVPPGEEDAFGKGVDADKILQRKLLANLNRGRGVPPPSAASPTPDSDLIGVMAARLAKLEAEVREVRDECSAKDGVIAAMKRKYEQLQASIPSQNTQSLIRNLQKENGKYQRKVHDMETFLNDYGLVWVGDDSDEDESAREKSPVIAPQPEDAGQHSTIEEVSYLLDITTVKARVRELNVLAGEGSATIVDGRLRHKEAVRLNLYKNGIFVGDDGRFWPFSEDRARNFMSDIVDGFFPYELKDQYPGGVPFDVVFNHERMYEEAISFPGQGQSIGGRSSLAAAREGPRGAVTKDAYLKRLPERVIRGGRVVEVRAHVESVLEGSGAPPSSPDVVLVRTDVIKLIENKSADRPATPKDVTTLQVKSPDGGPVLIVKLRFNDTIGTLREYIDAEGLLGRGSSYVLRTAFPSRMYTDPHETLTDAALVPSATLYIQL